MLTLSDWVRIRCKLPYRFLVDEGRVFSIQVDEVECLIRIRPSSEPFINDPAIGRSENLEMKNDRFGLFLCSEASILIRGPLLDLSPESILPTGITDDNASKVALDRALEVINLFVEVYRWLSGEAHIKRISPSSLPGFWIVNMDWYMDWYKDGEYVITSTLGLPPGAITLARNLAPESWQEELRLTLESKKPPIFMQLLLNARDYLNLSDHRMAVIESRTALELWLNELLMSEFAEFDPGELREILRVKNSMHIGDIVDSANINDKLRRGLRRAIGKSPADQASLWKRWLAAKVTREEVIHAGKACSIDEAKKHLSVVEEIFQFYDIQTVSPEWLVTYVQSGNFDFAPHIG